jgi:nucleoside permease NupC
VTEQSALFVFGFRVLPVILVICALSALLWHWRILRWATQIMTYALCGFANVASVGINGVDGDDGGLPGQLPDRLRGGAMPGALLGL